MTAKEFKERTIEDDIAELFCKQIELLDKFVELAQKVADSTNCECLRIGNIGITKNKDNRIIIYKDMECELIGTSDGGGTLNTGGLAFCIKLPDGSIKNVQDTDCKFK